MCMLVLNTVLLMLSELVVRVCEWCTANWFTWCITLKWWPVQIYKCVWLSKSSFCLIVMRFLYMSSYCAQLALRVHTSNWYIPFRACEWSYLWGWFIACHILPGCYYTCTILYGGKLSSCHCLISQVLLMDTNRVLLVLFTLVKGMLTRGPLKSGPW